MYEQAIAEYEAEIAAIDRRIAQLKTNRDWKNNARYKHLECMRSDLMRQLHEARMAAARGHPPDGGGGP